MLGLALSLAAQKPPIGGGAPAAYTTGGVHFNGASSIDLPSMAAANALSLSVSFWFQNAARQDSATYWVVDPTGGYRSAAYGDSGTHGIAAGASNAGGNGWSGHTTEPATGAWHHFMMSTLMGSPTTGALYLDRVLQDVVAVRNATAIQFLALALWLGNDTFGDFWTGDLADFWFAPGQSLLSGNTIPSATLDLFVTSGIKPVNLGADGSTPTGVRPATFLRRAPSALASTFATNLGTDGNFTINGTLTNAASSPSD